MSQYLVVEILPPACRELCQCKFLGAGVLLLLLFTIITITSINIIIVIDLIIMAIITM